MASPSTTARGSIQLDGVIGRDGIALITPDITVSAISHADIDNNREEVAPWLDGVSDYISLFSRKECSTLANGGGAINAPKI